MTTTHACRSADARGDAAPLVTSIRQGSRLVVAAAAPAARALGIAAGMAVTQARAQVPGLDIRPADPAGDRAALHRLAILAAQRWCPVVALDGEDGLLLEIAGTAHLFGGEAAMARRIVRLLARLGFTARVAVADTPGAAWALARYAMPAPRRDVPRRTAAQTPAEDATANAAAPTTRPPHTPRLGNDVAARRERIGTPQRNAASHHAGNAGRTPDAAASPPTTRPPCATRFRDNAQGGTARIGTPQRNAASHHARDAGRTPDAAASVRAVDPPPVTELRDDAAGGAVRIVTAGAQGTALAPLPVAALRIEPRALELLKRLGVDTIGQLAALPHAPLARRFGGRLVARLDQASGRLPEPLDPVVPPEHVAVVQRFAEPIATAEAIEHWLGTLMPRLTTTLAEAGLGARTIELVADRIDGVPQRLRIGLARPTRDAGHLLRLTVRRIEEIAPGYGIDALALHVRRADPLGAEPFAGTLDDRTPPLAPLIDTLANRIGLERLWRMVPVESDVPERSLCTTPPLDAPRATAQRLKRDDVRRLDTRATDHPWHPRWPRPPRLLRRPEPLDHVMAEMPDHAPRRFTWRGQVHRVVRADGPERIAGEWWQRASERDAIRDYFHVEDEVGARFWLFRRGDGTRAVTGDLAWFMHGSFG